MNKFSEYLKPKLPITAKSFNDRLEAIETRLIEELMFNRGLILSYQDNMSQLENKIDEQFIKTQELVKFCLDKETELESKIAKQNIIINEVQTYIEKLLDTVDTNNKSIRDELQKQTATIDSGIKDVFEQTVANYKNAITHDEKITNVINEATQTIDALIKQNTILINNSIKRNKEESLQAIRDNLEEIYNKLFKDNNSINKAITERSVFVNKEINALLMKAQQLLLNEIKSNKEESLHAIKDNLEEIYNRLFKEYTSINKAITERSEFVNKEINMLLMKVQQLLLNEIKNNKEQLSLQIEQEKELVLDNQTKLTELSNTVQTINDIKNVYSNSKTEIIDKLKRVETQTRTNYFAVSETVWSQVFHDTITKSQWLKDKTFSAGRWGVGYAFLYVLYRVLNEVKPQSILEMGLGESTKMIMQYAKSNSIAKHIVTEHDPNWVEFFTNKNKTPVNTEIKLLDLETSTYKTDNQVLSYAKFDKVFEKEKFDLICIDAPFGGKAIEYARVDVCRLLPNILLKRFVIMLDDSQRRGETHTAKEIETILTQNGISFKSGRYRGIKENYIVVSEDLAFLCTL